MNRFLRGCDSLRLRLWIIQTGVYSLAAALLSPVLVISIRQKPNQRSAKKRAEPATRAIGSLQRRVFQQMKQEFLCEVLRFSFGMAADSNELKERRPVQAAQIFQRLAPRRLATQRCSRQKGPVGRGKI